MLFLSFDCIGASITSMSALLVNRPPLEKPRIHVPWHTMSIDNIYRASQSTLPQGGSATHGIPVSTAFLNTSTVSHARSLNYRP